MLEANKTGYFPYTPGTNLLFGLNMAVTMLLEEGLPNLFARHDRHAEATRRAVRTWGLEVQCADPRHYSSSLTAVRVPEGHSADALRAVILEKCNMSLGNGLGILKDRVFRIGHLGDFGDLQLIGTLGGVEIGLRAAGVPHGRVACRRRSNSWRATPDIPRWRGHLAAVRIAANQPARERTRR